MDGGSAAGSVAQQPRHQDQQVQQEAAEAKWTVPTSAWWRQRTVLPGSWLVIGTLDF